MPQLLRIATLMARKLTSGGGPGAGVDDILMETGDHLLMETGDAILLDP